MSDEPDISDDDVSEALDGDMLGEEVGDEALPGTVGYPPDRALGAEDPTLLGDDDVETRELRREAAHAADRPVGLIDDNPVGDFDVEAQAWADEERLVDEVSAEEAAVHVVPDPERPVVVDDPDAPVIDDDDL